MKTKLYKQILQDLKVAMKSGNILQRDTLRSVDNMIKNEEIAQQKREAGLDESEILVLLKRAIKQRKDSVEKYVTGNRSDLAEKENEEIVVIQKYLPKQMTEDEVRLYIRDYIETHQVQKSDMGKTIGVLVKELGDQTDGSIVHRLLGELLK